MNDFSIKNYNYPLSPHEERLRVNNLIAIDPYLIKKIATQCLLSKDQATRGLNEVLRFLDLVARRDSKLTPSIVIDSIWHEFILFTRQYTDYCNYNYGRIIHHNPHNASNKHSYLNNQRGFLLTLQLYSRYYGEPNALFWGNMNTLDLSGNCSSCDRV